MGGRGSGRRPGPVENLIASGNYRPGKHGPRPSPAAGALDPNSPVPDGLNEYGAAEWTRLIGPLTVAGYLTEAERESFFNYCYWSGLARLAAIESAKVPTFDVLKKKNEAGELEGQRINRWLKLAADAGERMLVFARECGLTALTRGRVVKNPNAAAHSVGGVSSPDQPGTSLDALGPMVLKFPPDAG